MLLYVSDESLKTRRWESVITRCRLFSVFRTLRDSARAVILLPVAPDQDPISDYGFVFDVDVL